MNRTLVSKLKGGGKKESFLSLLLQTRTHMLLDIRFLCIYQKHSSQSSSLLTVSHCHTHTNTETHTHSSRLKLSGLAETAAQHTRAHGVRVFSSHTATFCFIPLSSLPASRSVLTLCHLYVNVCMSVFVCVCVSEKASRTCYTPEVAQAQ